ncbi:MAG: hypothetical protein ACE5KQ_02870 [Thermoplasmata archaeon]
MQRPPRKRKRRKKRPRFDADKVFRVVRNDLDFNLDVELARFRARKGEAGNRRSVGLRKRSDFSQYYF